MDSFMPDLVLWLEEVPVAWSYGLLALAAYVENVFPPVPGDLCIVFAGYMAAAGSLTLPLVVAVATATGVLGFMTVFHVGRAAGPRLVASGRIRWINANAVAKVSAWTARWGAGVVLINRFLAAVRSVVPLSVGMGSMRSSKALLLSAVAALIWTVLLAGAGFVAGENWEQIEALLARYSQVVLALAAVLIGASIWRSIYRKKKRV